MTVHQFVYLLEFTPVLTFLLAKQDVSFGIFVRMILQKWYEHAHR